MCFWLSDLKYNVSADLLLRNWKQQWEKSFLEVLVIMCFFCYMIKWRRMWRSLYLHSWNPDKSWRPTRRTHCYPKTPSLRMYHLLLPQNSQEFLWTKFPSQPCFICSNSWFSLAIQEINFSNILPAPGIFEV